ncbi:MAG: hypothetical protein ACRC4G_04755 [Alphaproteobacteria bacterium]
MNTKNRILNLIKLIINDQIDFIFAIRNILYLWQNSEIEKTDFFYFFVGIDSETESFLKGDVRKGYSVEYLEKIDHEEKIYLSQIKKEIQKICSKNINFFE